MAEEQAQSSWWGYASTAWSSIQETAKDFTDSLQEENEETINQIKERVDTETISNQISNATNSINTFLNTTIQTINTQNNSNPNHTKPKKQIAPKPFEKEKATYSLDPRSNKQHKEKYIKFIDSELGLTDNEICLKGRHLLEINSAICTYFESLVPNEIDEVTFWKRYLYWKYQTQLREILISRHTGNDGDGDGDDEEEEDVNDNEDVKVDDNVNNSGSNDTDEVIECDNEKGKDDGIVNVENKDDNGESETHDVNEKEESKDGNVVLKNKVNQQVLIMEQDEREQEELREDEEEDWAEWD